MQEKSLHQNVAAYIPMVEGVVKLFYPYVEGAIHDLQRGQVVALYNNISRRKVGDASAVTELGIAIKDFPDVFDPYYKTNWDGRRLKCVSVTIRDDTGYPIGLVCLNFDTSVFADMNVQLEKLLGLVNKNGLNPVEQFGDNWQQQASDFIDTYAREHNVAVVAMSKEQKADLVCDMYDHALFNYRDAASYIARQLVVSRTTVYNYLKKGKK
jgi:predicted transcriptional regulator YheO